jgi:uncharacterized phage protein (TIGR02220 family)
VRKFVIPEIFFKTIAEKGKLYSRFWFYWLSEFVDELFEPEFIEKQKMAFPKVGEITDIYELGVQLLQQEFKIIEEKAKKPKKVITKEHKKIAIEIIDYLNSMAETTFSIETGTNIELISDRIKEGYTLGDFKLVIDKKSKDWKGTDWSKYLRPMTLFSKSKFENYLNSITNESKPASNFSKFADSVAKAKIIIGIHRD